MDGWEDGRMNESPNVFYRIVSFSRPLSCFPHSDTKSNKVGARGIADHILPLGDWFSFVTMECQSICTDTII